MKFHNTTGIRTAFITFSILLSSRQPISWMIRRQLFVQTEYFMPATRDKDSIAHQTAFQFLRRI